MRHLILLPLLALLVAAPANAIAKFELPASPTYHVNDYARILSISEHKRLEERFVEFERRTGHQAAAAIFETTDDRPIEDVAVELFKKWGLGSTKQNNGILLVLAMKEHGVRIEVGYGLEGQLPDAIANRIIHDDMFPYLRRGETANAILIFTKRLDEIFIEGKQYSGRGPQERVNIFLVLLPFFIILLLAWMNSSSGGSGHSIGSRGVYRRNNSWWWWGGGGGWGGGSGWGSGGGFGGWSGGGGGSSGGGGASGRW